MPIPNAASRPSSAKARSSRSPAVGAAFEMIPDAQAVHVADPERRDDAEREARCVKGLNRSGFAGGCFV
jgi:hypothetical protein